jgi:septal ring factor EnvC (AmiA/AmiB activator)
MKYYSEITNKVYDTEELLNKAEEAEAAKKEAEIAKRNERSQNAKKVEEARKKATEAINAYEKELKDFCEKYGSYHTSIEAPMTNLFDFLFGEYI